MMMKLYLVRHGQSEGNLKKLLFGRTDYSLTPLGIEQAQNSAEKLKDAHFDVCWSSTLKRAIETAEICIAGRNIPMICDEGLCEQDMGDLENMAFDEAMKKEPEKLTMLMRDWSKYAPPGGESFEEMYKRVVACCEKIKADGRDALIVAHNGSLSMMTAYLLGADIRCVESFYHQHGCYTHIHLGGLFDDKRNTLVCFNK